MPSVWVVLVNYNGKEDTLECVASLKAQGYPGLHVVVVDNGSADGSATAFRQAIASDPLVTLIESPQNLGFAGGNNLGIRRALEAGADFVFLLNNDTVAEQGLVQGLADAAERDKDIGALSPLVTYYRDPDRIWFYDGAFHEQLCYMRHRHMGAKVSSEALKTQDVNFISGCAMFIRREVLERVGLLDEDYFLYFEDVEFSWRVRKAGYRLVALPQVVVRHKVSASMGAAGSNALTPLRAYYYGRNTFLFIRRQGSVPRKALWLTGQAVLAAPYYTLTSMTRSGQRLKTIRAYLRGVRHGLGFLLTGRGGGRG